MVDSTLAKTLIRQRRRRRAWLPYVIPALLLILRVCFEPVFDGVTAQIVHALSRATDDSTRLMAEAGWLTIALLPLAVVVGVEDRRKRLGFVTSTVAEKDGTGVIHLTTRVKSDIGHSIARRPMPYWIRRVPLLLGFALAVLFWPLTGASMASRWTTTPGGVAFSIGWRVSLGAAALSILIMLAEPWLTAALGRRPGLAAIFWRMMAFVLPILALAVTLIIK